MRFMLKALLVLLTIIVSSMVGCSCRRTPRCEAGPCADTGAGATCSATMPCPGGQTCVAGTCTVTAHCSGTMPCPLGLACAGGLCTIATCSDTMPCPSGLYCAGGACTADCSSSVACTGGAMCAADGRCVGGACTITPPISGCGDPCSATMSCRGGLYCSTAGICTADCSASVQCTGTQTCSPDGHCVGGGMDAGVCSGAGAPMGCGAVCTATLPCPAGTYCFSGRCTADCSGRAPCAGGLTCSSQGHCVAASPDAGTGMACLDPRSGLPDPNFRRCGTSACVHTNSDPDNCGMCGHACLASQVCSNGTCMSTCGPPNTNCARHCVNVLFDARNCGMCGRACPLHDPSDPMALDQACYTGVCGCATMRGETLCGSMCVNVDSDRTNCGSCGVVCNTTCPSHPDTCVLAGYECGQAGDGCGGPLDCGGCAFPGDTCGGGGVPSQCGRRTFPDGGIDTCVPRTSCPAGYCGPYPDGCGGAINCPTTCNAPDTCGGGGVLHQCGHPVCSHTTCVDMCPPGTTNCSDRCLDLSANQNNCGACGNTCGALGSCNGGSCVCNPPSSRDAGPGALACPATGCIICAGVGCVNPMNDRQHCGDCSTVCPSGLGHNCVMGRCT